MVPQGLRAADRESAPRSLAEQAYQHLVHDITRLDLAPGEVLAEKALMERLQIGRTPIREALQRIAMEGLALHLPNRGMFVSEITATSVQQIYEFRSLIDGHAASLAAVRATTAETEELESLHQSLLEATADDDVDRYVTMDRLFYDVLADATRNIYLAEVIPRIFNLHLRLWFFISNKTGGWHTIAASHQEMTRNVVDAIRRRNADEAELAMKTYISRRHEDLRGIL